ncbi:hypothetical protein NUU61_003764 [Penicillium alfredii]|uniref:Vps72/YL1 C-terminal domain-containing protein n=1 Tax=Penicillium alfredii TaxID=1506179 RepID=A0A9W9FKE3_9EURO|nr:uncharacterized protein NUU61_003764 [Penicillium alfredii]KAJ5101542.1 hypothetical protein NUU61_003764 [Penicillium alfredii]
MADMMEEDPSSGIQSSEEEEEQGEQVESLIRGRAKRSTAGRHMSALIDAAADDDLTLLFQEVEDDNEFAAEADVEAAEEDEMGLDSSSDDDDDQGPNAQNDYAGEQELQKEERRKRKAQNDLRFQTLRKRVKIDPTAVSAVSTVPAARPKKKSERISWIPTPEDGPTRSSSRRQTMHNKELTHARLKDSQEKRVRIIATMKEAEKRKAHLKPKEMTQEDHLAEAERVERSNSKSLNRWEQAERRKADERRAKIEALQNRRLEGPVMSYWSGLATWVNGRLTRVGQVDIKPKPDKDEVARKKKKMEKEEKAAAEARGSVGVPGAGAGSAGPMGQPSTLPAQPGILPVGPAEAGPSTDQKPLGDNPPENTAPVSSEAQPGQPNGTTSQDQPSTIVSSAEKKDNAETTTQESKPSHNTEIPTVPASAPSQPSAPAVDTSSDSKAEPPVETAPNTDFMIIDSTPDTSKHNQEQGQQEPTTGHTSLPTAAVEQPPTLREPSNSNVNGPRTEQPVVNGDAVVSTITASTPPTAAPTVSSAEAAPSQPTPPQHPTIQGLAPHPPVQAAQPDGMTAAPVLPAIPPPPPVIEHTGRTLTILENFDDKTAQSRKYSMYFNAKKPPRLTKISSSLCVITSLPSRYRDPETSLPYANSYAYGQIQQLLSQGYIWSSMLGCFVGSPDTAARGVPERFLGGAKARFPELEPDPAATSTKDESRPNGESTPVQAASGQTVEP